MTYDDWVAAMAEAPDDFDLRRVAADWCEENGRDADAARLRWMATHRKRPRFLRASTECQWYDKAAQVCKPPIDPQSDLPTGLYELLRAGEKRWSFRHYDRFSTAEADIAQAWARWQGAERHTPCLI
jgi:hypothetical protein